MLKLHLHLHIRFKYHANPNETVFIVPAIEKITPLTMVTLALFVASELKQKLFIHMTFKWLMARRI